jgi:hypothetical protein
MDWSFNEENQKKYDEVTANIRRLQAEFGIKSRTLEERAADYQQKQAEKAQLEQIMGKRRPPPKWKL